MGSWFLLEKYINRLCTRVERDDPSGNYVVHSTLPVKLWKETRRNEVTRVRLFMFMKTAQKMI